MAGDDHAVKTYLLALALMLLGAAFMHGDAHALGLKVAPLEYRTTLKTGDKQKGFIDISNPSDQKVTVRSSVQAFRQTDNQGTLQFYDDEQVAAGTRLDLDEFELGPKEAVRMFFILDSTKLPSGDVFEAIFFTTNPTKPTVGMGEQIKLGTLLSIVNGAPGPRDAVITDVKLPFLQFDSSVRGTYTIRNTADPHAATGFYPTVSLRAQPFGERTQQRGKLVFAGRSRQNSFRVDTPPIGLYKVSVGYRNGVQSRYVLVMTPLAIMATIGSVVGLIVLRKLMLWYRGRSSNAGNSR